LTLLVFVIHSEDDFPIFKMVEEQAKSHDIKFLLAELMPEPGLLLTNKIDRLLRESNLVLVIWSKTGQDSIWVNQEVGFVKALNKRIVPFIETGVQPQAFLVGLEWIEYNKDQPEKGIVRLIDWLVNEQKKYF
jgi:hypothetical protein